MTARVSKSEARRLLSALLGAVPDSPAPAAGRTKGNTRKAPSTPQKPAQSATGAKRRKAAQGRGSEHAEQAALVAMCAAHAGRVPALALLYAIPNGGARDVVTGARLKAEGVRKGVLDLHLPVARQGHIGLWIEMKYGRNDTTPEQDWWIEALTNQGHRVVVCRSADEAFQELCDYLEMIP